MNRSKLSRTLAGAMLTALLGSVALTPANAATAPVITWDSAITDGATFLFGQVPQETCTAVDGDTGQLPVPCVVTGYDAAVGVHTLTATATDASLTTIETRTYTVEAWTLKGFYRPVKMGEGVWNKVKGGSTVPLKFKVFQGDAKAKDVGVVASLTAQQISCVDLSALADPTPVASSHKGFGLKYRDGAFHQNWKTPKAAKAPKPAKGKKVAAEACYQVTLTTQDASTLTALFQLK